MRILIIHPDDDEAKRIHRAALQVWGGPRLVEVEIIRRPSMIDQWLADETRWPDVILANVGFMERHIHLARQLETHPARGFYRLLALSTGSDEYVRALLQRCPDEIVLEPVTRHKLLTALCS